MQSKGESKSPTFNKDTSLTAELQRLGEKLQHAYQRRDHYAQLYYKVAAKLEDTERELLEARKEIQALKSQDFIPQRVWSEHTANNEVSNQFRDDEYKRPGPSRINPYRTVQIINMPPDSSNQTSPKPLVKRVAFSDEQRPIAIQRSSSVSEGERHHGMYSPPPINNGMQRTQSFSYGKPQLSANRSHPSTPPSIHSPMHGNPFPHSYDHRLPRIHRSLAYETSVPSGGGYPHHSQGHLPLNSQQFQSNSLNRSAFRAAPPLSADYRNQPHYSSLPLRNQHTIQMFDGDVWRVKRLNRAGLIALFSEISTSEVPIKKLEISSSGLGDLEMMSLLCRELRKKQTIEELSLPNNDIGKDSLSMLLDTLMVCKTVRHVKLMNNDITKNCLEIIQNFFTKTSVQSFILTGNEIEHHTHLLDHPLPQESNLECHDNSNDSAHASPPPPQGIYGTSISPVNDTSKLTGSLPHNMKLLQI